MAPSLLLLRNDREMVARPEDFVREDLYLFLLSRMVALGLLSSATAVCRTREDGEISRQGVRVLLRRSLTDLTEEARGADVLWVRGDRALYQPVLRSGGWPTRLFYAAARHPLPRLLWGFDALMVDEPEHLELARRRHPGAVAARFLKTANDELFFVIPGTPKRFDVCCFGRMDSVAKNYAALPAIIHARPELSYVVVGKSEPRLRARIEAVGAAVHFTDGVTRARANELLNASSVGLILSQDDGGPRTILESMAADLPQVVNAKLAVGRSYVTPRAGIVAELEAFPEAIDAILRRTQDYAPAQEFHQRFSPDIAARNIAGVIEQARQRSRPGAGQRLRRWWNNWPLTAHARALCY